MAVTRERLREIFGMDEPVLRLGSSRIEDKGTHVLERLQFETGDGTRIRGFLTRPVDGGRHPAIVYAHSHGGRHEIGARELIEGREYLLSPPLGPVLAEAGYVTLMLDMPAFGERATITESAATKAALWYGKSLFGQMLSENAAAVTWLGARADVDAARIGMFGMSMGCTLSYWLAAVDERIAAVAHLCCFCDLATLVEMGAQDLHGIYLTVPGLLAATTTGEIAGLVAPRPQLICVGGDDPLTPPRAVDVALETARSMYGGGPLQVFRQEGIGHQETAQMRAQVLDFFRRTLG
jgi:dienelactone hydrolase